MATKSKNGQPARWEKYNLPDDDLVLDFKSATVIYKVSQPRLYVQAIDEYGYQRELSVERINFKHADCKWRAHTYRQPQVRHIEDTTESVALRFVSRFLDIAQNWPTLLFCDRVETASRAVNAGFVRLHETLLHERFLSVELLD